MSLEPPKNIFSKYALKTFGNFVIKKAKIKKENVNFSRNNTLTECFSVI